MRASNCMAKDDKLVHAMQQAQADKLDHWAFYQTRRGAQGVHTGRRLRPWPGRPHRFAQGWQAGGPRRHRQGAVSGRPHSNQYDQDRSYDDERPDHPSRWNVNSWVVGMAFRDHEDDRCGRVSCKMRNSECACNKGGNGSFHFPAAARERLIPSFHLWLPAGSRRLLAAIHLYRLPGGKRPNAVPSVA